MKDQNLDVEIRGVINEAIGDFQNGRQNDALVKARSVYDRIAGVPGFDPSDADILNAMCIIGEKGGDADLALAAMRETARLQGRPVYLNGFNYFRLAHHSRGGAVPDDISPGLRAEDRGTSILIACIPKSGSTFLFSVLMEVLGFEGPKLCLNYANEENILAPELVQPYLRANTVVQEHCRATPQNVAIAQAMGSYTVVLVRNIFDSIISMRDMLLGKDFGSANAFFTDNLPDMSEEQQLDAVIAKWAHWQLEFLVSWRGALDAGRVRGHILTYESLMADKIGEIGRICSAVGRPADPDAIERVLSDLDSRPKDTRLNVGRSGRGRAAMSDAQMDRIRALTAIYPDTDFSLLGL